MSPASDSPRTSSIARPVTKRGWSVPPTLSGRSRARHASAQGCRPAAARSPSAADRSARSRALAEIVGPHGAVTGIDASGDALALAGALLARRGVANVRVVEAHIDAELPDDITAHGSFDVAYTRRFLVHQRDPARTLARIASLLRRGGRIVAHEIPPGSGYPRMTPPEPALERVDALVHTAVGRRGGRPDAALHLAVLCRQAGLRLIEERGFVPAAEPVALLETFQAVLRSIASFVVAEGVTSAGEVTELLSALDKAKPVDRVSAFANLYLEVIAEVP